MDGDEDDRVAAAGPRHGTAVPRGQDIDRRPDAPHGRFGWMFPHTDESDVDPEALDELAKWMAVDDPTQRSDNIDIPAGFTYLGQFMDHDITFDPISKLDRRNDPRSLVNFRTPRFDLDSVYGSGPADEPFLYDWLDSKPRGTRLLVGQNADKPDLASEDLPRNSQGRALIGDARNDENVIVAQLHLLFIKFHNAVVEHLRGDVDDDDLFEEAQRMVRWHYQWIVVHEFMPKVVGQVTAARVLRPPARGGPPEAHLEHFTSESEPFIPVEFSGAAYRFGHSMVRADYGLQRRAHRATPLFPDLAGLTWLPKRLVIDWERFFELPGAERPPQSSQLINTRIVKPLWTLPRDGRALPRSNLKRGWSLRLPSGQCVATKMEEPVLEEEELLLDDTVPSAAREALLSSTPLWFYILCEAATTLNRDGPPRAGSHLGPVGGRIVAEVIVGLLEADPTSYLSKKPSWRPDLGNTPGKFTMADLIAFAQGPIE